MFDQHGQDSIKVLRWARRALQVASVEHRRQNIHNWPVSVLKYNYSNSCISLTTSQWYGCLKDHYSRKYSVYSSYKLFVIILQRKQNGTACDTKYLHCIWLVNRKPMLSRWYFVRPKTRKSSQDDDLGSHGPARPSFTYTCSVISEDIITPGAFGTL